MTMDDDRFDRWARRLGSRRYVVATIVGASVAFPIAAANAATSSPNRKGAKPARKRHGKHGHGSGGQAFGCTKQDSLCSGLGSPVQCPNFLAGFCVIFRKKPMCASLESGCDDCTSDADCQKILVNPKARCIENCSACRQAGSTGFCVVPVTATPTAA